MLNQINRLKGENTIIVAEKIGYGTQNYTLINIDEEKNGENNSSNDTENTPEEGLNENEDNNENDFDNDRNSLQGSTKICEWNYYLLALLLLII